MQIIPIYRTPEMMHNRIVREIQNTVDRKFLSIRWQYAPKRKLIKIANIQKRSACMILDKSWDHPSNPLFKELNWLPLQSRITYHESLLVFKIILI